MGKFAKPEKQAASVVKALQDISSNQRANHEKMALPSLGTARDFQQCLKLAAEWMQENKFGSLRDMTKEQAISYLEQRAEEVGQKTLDQDRQAIQKMQQALTHELNPEENLPVIKSEKEQILEARAYTEEQMQAIATAQSAKNALATEISYASGVRAHELLNIRKLEERAPSDRPARSEKFSGRPEGVLYTVKGKGGLVRVVSLPKDLSERLEATRREKVVTVIDRGIAYRSRYDIGGGQSWSRSFSRASTKVLGFSNGAHGLRHSYAQDRMEELRLSGMDRPSSLEVVSQEMGHFRPDITETYLR